MTNSDLVQSVWRQTLDACRGTPVDEGRLARFLGQYVAWHLLPVTFTDFPEHLHAPKAGGEVTGDQIDRAWQELMACDALGDARYAFATDPKDVHQHLSKSTLSKLNDFLWGLILFDARQREELARTIASACLNEFLRAQRDIPQEIAEFMVRLVAPKKGEGLFCPGPMPNALAVAAMQRGARPRIVTSNPPVPACIYAAVTGAELDVVIEDPYRPEALAKDGASAERIATICPRFGKLGDKSGLYFSQFGVRTLEALGIELALRQGAERVAVLVPNGFLFTSGPDQALRRYLVEKGLVASVIAFPGGLLSGTSISFSVLLLTPKAPASTAVFCKVDEKEHLSGRGKLRVHDQRFVGADHLLQLIERPDGVTAVTVELDRVQEQDCLLTPDRYLSPPDDLLQHLEGRVTPLGDLVVIVKPQFLPANEGEAGVAIQEATPGEMPEFGFLTRVERVRRVDPELLDAKSSQVLQRGDVLLSTKGTIGTVAIADPTPDQAMPLLPSQASVILRIRSGAGIKNPRFLAMYLRSPAVQKILEALSTGGTIPNISLADLRAIPVWVPSMEEQERLVEAFDRQADIEHRIAELAAEQREITNRLWRELGLSGSAGEPRVN
ncbi:N-6 DNA methylase [Wenzhouxiangella sp. XN24]|uniref:N-6 DNA methylase n=1 Tax=Wenzhouxiangella sp. XN24 TaxID=2713569 RepID=UPI0013EBB777|nr:N-6 DNA methylase [Wenzhouxiangella sp. XN24]NGX16140.1 N-6 DNA methylase [Wenzhouxiangella sp. XN24]